MRRDTPRSETQRESLLGGSGSFSTLVRVTANSDCGTSSLTNTNQICPSLASHGPQNRIHMPGLASRLCQSHSSLRPLCSMPTWSCLRAFAHDIPLVRTPSPPPPQSLHGSLFRPQLRDYLFGRHFLSTLGEMFLTPCPGSILFHPKYFKSI